MCLDDENGFKVELADGTVMSFSAKSRDCVAITDLMNVNATELALIRSGRQADEAKGHGHIEPGMWRALATLCSLRLGLP